MVHRFESVLACLLTLLLGILPAVAAPPVTPATPATAPKPPTASALPSKPSPPPVSTNMSSAIPEGYDYHVVAPTNHAGLTCRFLKPADFKIADLPPAEPDFSKGAQFMPLAIALTQYGPMVFSLAARPAYDDGAVSQWLEYICREENYPHTPVTETRIGKQPAVTCDATQKTDDVTMKMRFVLFEDGGRLFQMAAMAPEPLWSAAIAKMEPMLASLELRERRGTKVPLRPGAPPPTIPDDAPPAVHTVATHPEPTPTPTPAPATDKSGSTPPAPALVSSATPAPASTPSTNATPTAVLQPHEMVALALADDTQSLDPEQRINANLRNRGAGLVPNLVDTDPKRKCARLAAGAVQGILRVPFGWHVIDDGRRTLVFDAGGRIQINLNQRLHEGTAHRAFARGLLQEHLNRQPDLTVLEVEIDGVACAGVRGVSIDGETLDQHFLVRDLGRQGTFLVARVTSSAADTTRAMDLAGDIIATFEAPRTSD